MLVQATMAAPKSAGHVPDICAHGEARNDSSTKAARQRSEALVNWLFELYQTNPAAHAIAILSLVCVAGMALGSVSFRGIKLGTSGVFFAAIIFGHFIKPIDCVTLDFVKEFGLILFVFCIGLQLGPGFFASLCSVGLRLNLLALAIVAGGAIVAGVAGWLLRIDGAAVLGVFAGATTNTPALGAGQQTLASFSGVSEDRAALPALAYAVTYPAAILGIIGTLLALKAIFRIDPAREAEIHAATAQRRVKPLERRTLIIANDNLAGVSLGNVPGLTESGVVVSRICPIGQEVSLIATSDIVLQVGDRILVVGSTEGLEHFQRAVGRSCEEHPIEITGAISPRRIVVTQGAIHGMSVQQLELAARYGVNVTRITRGELELAAVPSLRIQFGDELLVVGTDDGIKQVEPLLGNSLQALNETQFVPLFAGISLGVALGTLPIRLLGLPQPLRVGLAGGPLIVAILVGRFGRIGRLVLHMPRSVNLAFKEFGIALFFASVGLLAGPTFFGTAFSRTGLTFLFAGVCVTVLPLLAVGTFARKVLAMDYVDLSGLLAGSMTDPPALAFANGICGSEGPTVAYATVYPLTMLVRIVAAQILAVLLCG
jgi:putative transport protein